MDKFILMIALTPIKYRGKRIEETAEFECHEDDTDDLVDADLIAFTEDSLPIKDVSSNNQRTMDLMEAINSLDKNNPTLWTRDKKPKTEAIEAVEGFGLEVSAALRDDVWTDMQAAADES